MELFELPQFVVDEVGPASADGEAVVMGRFTQQRGIRNAGGFLYRRPGPSIVGTLTGVPATPGEVVTFRTFDLALAPELRPGMAYPWIDQYWQPHHVDMVLAGQWEARAFAALDAHYFRLDGVTGWQPVGMPLPEGAEDMGVRAGGWDHEHCELCRAHVGGPGAAEGFVDPHDHWLCAACHQRYAVTRDLAFLVEG